MTHRPGAKAGRLETFELRRIAGDRDVLQVHSRGDESRPLTGVFGVRSPARPNPIGLHRTTVVAVDGNRVQVAALEAIDGTPIVDLKPVLGDER